MMEILQYLYVKQDGSWNTLMNQGQKFKPMADAIWKIAVALSKVQTIEEEGAEQL